jgi:type IV pilus assembly protein PilQ
MTVTGMRSLNVVVVAVALAVAASPGVSAQDVSILGMAWTSSPAPALVVSATGPLQFTYDRPEPGVLAVDFPGVLLAEPPAPVSQPGQGLARASLLQVGDGSAPAARLRIEVAAGYEAAVRSLPAGVEVRFTPATAQVAAARELTDVQAIADESGVSVLLTGGAPLAGKVFALPDPPRVVVDLPGVVNRVSRRVLPVDSQGVSRVRIAQFASAPDPVVRVVVDLAGEQGYRLESTAQGAVLRIGGAMPEQVAAVPPPAPEPQAVAAVAAPAAAEPLAVQPAPLEPVALEPAAVAAATTAAEVPAEVTAAPPPPVEAAAPVTPVTIVDDTEPPAAEPAAVPPPAESPWTTSPAAMVEQAPPATSLAGTTTEVQTEERRFTGEPISMELKDSDIKDVLRSFAKITGLNIVVDPDVSGSVTVNLENVPWDQCLDIVLRINRLDYVVENNVLRVAKVERLTQEKQALAALREQDEASKPMRTVTKALSYAKAKEVSQVLTSQGFILSQRGTVVVDDRTNTMIIRDTVDRLEGIVALIDQLDQPNPQVIIEARIVETTRSFSQALGVVWGFTGLGDVEHGTNTSYKFPYQYSAAGGVGLPIPGFGSVDGLGSVLAFTFTDILNAFNLDFALQAAETDGTAKIVSSPKVTAQNNEKAHIESGIRLPIQTVANNTVTVQYINATLNLDVTPQITAEGTVVLDIDLKKEEPVQGINIAQAQNVPIITRNARTRLLVRDGGTTVIGGIYKFSENNQSNSIPGMSKIPIIGWLFKSRETGLQHDELLIFITPRIVKY